MLPGTATWIVGVIVNVPMPEVVAELKIFTAVGGPAPAGTVRGYVMLFVAALHVPVQVPYVGPVGWIVEARVERDATVLP